MKLIVGLGNPGRQYENTRHNVGFWTIEKLANKFDAPRLTRRFEAMITEGRYGQERILLAMPQTYMNLSGRAVSQICAFYKLSPSDVIVVHDDLDLPEGKLRVRPNGSAGGHNGIKSIIECLGTQDFARIKIGIGRPADSRMDSKDYVLAQCGKEAKATLMEVCTRACDAIVVAIDDGVDKAMNRFNGDPRPTKPKLQQPPDEGQN